MKEIRPDGDQGQAAAAIVMAGVAFSYPGAPDAAPVLEGIELSVGKGEVLILLGPSGCGKTTILSLLAGFSRPRSGTISIDGRPAAAPGPDRGMVFQDSGTALFEWLTVRENVGFGLRVGRVATEERERRIGAALRIVNLTEHADKFLDHLSGGMKQRVQIARLLAMQPRTVLLDEPFAALDAQTRDVLQRQFLSIWAQTGWTVVFVTHDIREAVNLGQRIMLMSAGPGSRIRNAYDVSLAYPRDQADPLYIELLSRISADLEQEVARAWR